MQKNILIVFIIVLILLTVGAYFVFFSGQAQPNQQNQQNQQELPESFDIQGMKVEILKEGSGIVAKTGDVVTVNYVGTLTDGSKFDSSIDRNQPFQFILGQSRVIQGWELGVSGMKVGEKRRLTIPPELGYGSNGFPPVIPPNATLIFEIDLLEIN